MRLYLSSYRIGDRAGALLALLGFGKRAAIIENALDGISPGVRDLYRTETYDPAAELGSLGIDSKLLDLREYFGNPNELRTALRGFDLVWVMGGNTFTLRRAMKSSGFDRVIVDMLDNDEIVYGGFSAGAVIAGQSLMGMELMDDPSEVPAGYDHEIVWEGLGLVDFGIVPHFRSAHPEAGAAEKAAKYFAARKLPFRTLRDGEAIVWTGQRVANVSAMRRSA